MQSVTLTAFLLQLSGAFFAIATPVVASVIGYYIQQRIKDRNMANLLCNAMQNAVGKIQIVAQGAADQEIQKLDPRLNVPAWIAPGVQYMIDHAPEALDHFGITPQDVADKILAQIGVKNIQANQAVNSSNTPVIIPPLAAVPDKMVAITPPVLPQVPPAMPGA